MRTIVESSSAGTDLGRAAHDSGLPGDQPVPGAEISPRDASQDDTSMRGTGPGDDLAAWIEQEVSRRFQSVKDKRWAQLEKQYRDLSTLRQDADALMAAVEAAEAASSADFEPAEIEPEELAGRILSLANLPGIRNNEDATALILRHREAQDLAGYLDLVEGLLVLTLGDGADELPVSPATAASAVIPGGGQAADDLMQEYQRHRMQIRLGDINALTALKREFRQKGLDVF